MPEFPHDEKQTELVNMLTEGLVQYEKALESPQSNGLENEMVKLSSSRSFEGRVLPQFR